MNFFRLVSHRLLLIIDVGRFDQRIVFTRRFLPDRYLIQRWPFSCLLGKCEWNIPSDYFWRSEIVAWTTVGNDARAPFDSEKVASKRNSFSSDVYHFPRSNNTVRSNNFVLPSKWYRNYRTAYVHITSSLRAVGIIRWNHIRRWYQIISDFYFFLFYLSRVSSGWINFLPFSRLLGREKIALTAILSGEKEI